MIPSRVTGVLLYPSGCGAQGAQSAFSALRRTALKAGIATMIEPLELRKLLSAQLEGGVLRVTGTDGHDRFRIFISSGDLIVDQDGDQTSFKASDVDQLQVSAGDGDDQVLLFPEIRNAQ